MADKTPFDAPAHMRKIRTRQGMQDYLDVKWRVAWLRAEFPTAQMITEQVEGDETHARFKCTITLPNGGISTGHGSETEKDFPDFYEKAETKAIGRACATLGYGTDAATDFDDGEPLDGAAAGKGERASRKGEDDKERSRANSPAPDGASPRTDWLNVVLREAKRVGAVIAADMTFDGMTAAIAAAGGPVIERGDSSAANRDAVLTALKGMPDAASGNAA